jgi:Outer membrane protein (porin)
VVWQIEGDISGDGTTINGGDTANKLGSSDTFLGLEGAWGMLRLGNLSDYMNDDMATMDPWLYSDETVSGLGIMTRFDDTYGNSIRYDSPEFGGFTFNALYSADEERENGDNAFMWGIGAGFEYESLFVKGGFMGFEEQNGSGDKSGHYWRIEAGYENDLSVIVAYQQSRQYGAAATGDTNSVWGRGTGDYGDFLGASTIAFGDDDKLKTQEAAITIGYQFGAFTPRVSVAWGDDVKMNGQKLSDSGYMQYVAGFDYVLSKRTLLYLAAGYVDYDGKLFTNGEHDSEHTVGIGLQHTF